MPNGPEWPSNGCSTSPDADPAAPAVSVVVPTFNERAHIRDCLTSLLRQDHPSFEILVVDGGSDDGTPEIVGRIAAEDPRVQLLQNPRRSAAAALNVGLGAARGEHLVRADAHALYHPDYVRRSVELVAGGVADDAGGPMRPVGTTAFGRAVAAVTTSPLGIGWGAFHYATTPTAVDTVFLGAYRTDLLRRLGGWDDETLQWGAEDHELNFRLRATGGTIVCDPAIRSWYFPRDTPRALWRQYRNYGLGKVSTLRKHGRLPTARPLVPATFVAGAAAGVAAFAATRKARYLLPLAAWSAVALGATRRAGTDARPHHVVAALAICHTAYGVGFWSGVARVALGRPFETAPRGRR